MKTHQAYCSYFQAIIPKDRVWIVTGILRSEPNMVFDRSLNKRENLFEFFVPPAFETTFINMMDFFLDESYIISYKKMLNRLMEHSN